MAFQSLFSKHKILASYIFPLVQNKFLQSLSTPRVSTPAILPELVNEVSRIVSDHRHPHHDLQLSLTPFSSQVSTYLVEQVLKRYNHLGFSAHRFFLWAKSIPGFEHSVESLPILVEILGRSKQFAILWDFLLKMRESESSSCKISNKLSGSFSLRIAELICLTVLFGLLFEWTNLESSLVLLILICFCSLYARRDMSSRLNNFFDQNKSCFSLTAKTYSILISGWGKVGDSGKARELFEVMLEQGCDVDLLAYNNMLDALCKGGRVDEAMDFF
ncbi:unnamed protein product [Lathyrus sativus]|nr:unnamed protein product [Lathyrus sativus]